MRRFAVVGICAALAGCATVQTPETPGQAIYEALGTYAAALSGARAYVESPTADPKIIHFLAKATGDVAPALVVGRAWQICASTPESLSSHAPDITGAIRPCASFDFSATNLRYTASMLRNAAITLGRR